MKKALLKIAGVMKIIFGYGIMICLLVGGLTFFGYAAAVIIGGDTAAAICAFISEKINPMLVLVSTSMILLGLISMYISGETGKKKPAKAERDTAAGNAESN